MPEDEDPIRDSVARDHERTEGVEEIVDVFESDLEDPKYPVRKEELAEWHATQVPDVPNETEALGSAIDRMAEESYSTRAELEEELVNALTGPEEGPQEFNDERDLRRVAEAVSGSGSVDYD